MTEFAVPPLPEIILSDADESVLPITSFHLVVIVEPNPESYMLPPGDIGRLGEVLYDLYTHFDKENDPDNPDADPSRYPSDVEETVYIWLRNEDESVNFFDNFAETAIVKASFNIYDAEDTEHLEYYLDGVKMKHPDWRIAVMGAVYEDEIIRIANFLQKSGFSTTVLARYCLSNKIFLNLDNLIAHDQWVRTAGRKEGEPFRSWFDDWMNNHGIDLDDDEDEEEK